jgi:hypothetical protein
MPYITQDRRVELDPHINKLVHEMQSHGELNYTISRLASAWLIRTCFPNGVRYTDRQHVYGTLCAVATEFYRRVLRQYEDGARGKNGDLAEYDALDKLT